MLGIWVVLWELICRIVLGFLVLVVMMLCVCEYLKLWLMMLMLLVSSVVVRVLLV